MRIQRPAQHQRGVALVFAAISLLASLAALALAIDIGRLYFERRDLQRVANMAALDAARIASGCVGPVENPDAAAYNEARASLVRNSGGDTDLTGGGSVVLGRALTGTDGVPGFTTSVTTPSAVQVQLLRDPPARLLPRGGGGTLKLRAIAAATALPLASLSVGSSLAELSPGLLNQLLGDQLGGPVDLSLLSYRGLFNASVELGDVLAAADLGSPTDFFTASTSAPGFLNAIADALSTTTDVATRSTLESLAAVSDGSRQVVPGDVVGVPPGLEEAASGAAVNVGAVTQAAAQAANGENLITVPADLNIPGVTGAGSVTTRLIQTANPVVSAADDGTQASNAQALVQIDLPLLPILGNPVNLKLWLQAAQATAQVTEIECARSGFPQPVVHVRARSSVARLGIGAFDDINGDSPVPRPAPLVNLNLLGIPITITASAVANVGQAEDRALIYPGPFDVPQTQRIGADAGEALGQSVGSLARSLQLEVQPEGALLNPLIRVALQGVLNTLTSQLTPVLNQVDQLLVPALAPLGLTLGGADVTVTSVTGEQPVLFNR